MAGHLNHKINQYGRRIAGRVLAENGFLHIRGEKAALVFEKQGVKYLVNVNTKRPDTRHGEKVTGKNQKDIDRLLEKQGEHKCDEVLMVFCDAQSKTVTGATLKKLMEPQTFAGLDFPLIETTHSNRIIFFSIYLIPTLGHMEGEEKDELADLIIANQSDKNQIPMFK